MRQYNHIKYEENDLVFYQEKNKKSWRGPVPVCCHRGRDVFVIANGNIKKIADSHVQPYKIVDNKEQEQDEDIQKEKKKEESKVEDKCDQDDKRQHVKKCLVFQSQA